MRQQADSRPVRSGFQAALRVICEGGYDTVAFDLFDTLVLRPFFVPSQIFRFLAVRDQAFHRANGLSDFVEKRRFAEMACREKLALSGLEECRLSEIYVTFGLLYGQPPSVTDRLCELEEEAELEFCRPRESGVALFRAALSAGRRVIVITDSCLESASLEKLLQKCGIKGYEAVYSSADCRRLKRTGTLFTWVRRHRPGTKILHIGDNRETDVEMAKRMGLAAVHIPGARENLTGPFADEPDLKIPALATFCASASLLACCTVGILAINFGEITGNTDYFYRDNPCYAGAAVFGPLALFVSLSLLSACRKGNYNRICLTGPGKFFFADAFRLVAGVLCAKGKEPEIFTELKPRTDGRIIGRTVALCAAGMCPPAPDSVTHDALALVDLPGSLYRSGAFVFLRDYVNTFGAYRFLFRNTPHAASPFAYFCRAGENRDGVFSVSEMMKTKIPTE